MNGVAGKAVAAMRWRAAQLAGVEAIYFLRLLILAKLLAPDAFGLLAIASVAVSILMRLSDVGMIPALVHRRDATPEQHDAAWTVGLVRAMFVTLALVIAAPAIAALFDQPDATVIIQALAVRPLIDSAASIGNARLTRDLRFRELAFINVPGVIVDTLVAATSAPSIGVWALVAGALAGSVTTTSLSYVFAPQRPTLRFQWAEVAPLVNYGRWVLAMGAMTLAGTLVTQVAVSRMLGATALGLYFLAVKVAFLPIDAAGAVVGAVAFPLFSGLREDAEASRRAFRTLLTGLWLLLLPAYALILALAPQFEFALGARWSGTAPIIQILSFAAVAGIVGELLTRLLMGQGRVQGAFAIESLQTLVVCASIVPCLHLLQVKGAAVAWVLGGAATLVLSILWLKRLLPGMLTSARARFLVAPVVALAAGLVARVVSVPIGGLGGLIAGGFAGVATGALALLAANAWFGLRLQDFQVILRIRNE